MHVSFSHKYSFLLWKLYIESLFFQLFVFPNAIECECAFPNWKSLFHQRQAATLLAGWVAPSFPWQPRGGSWHKSRRHKSGHCQGNNTRLANWWKYGPPDLLQSVLCLPHAVRLPWYDNSCIILYAIVHMLTIVYALALRIFALYDNNLYHKYKVLVALLLKLF